jgi:peroxiredoxin Q/BCP
MAFIEEGSPAPDFTLQDQHGEKVKLSSFKGKKNVLVYFYPKAMTPGCTVQACSIRDHSKDFKKAEIEVLGISTDPVDRLQKFEEKEKLNFTLLSDEDHKVADKYGAWGKKKNYGKEYMGLIRSSFLVGKDGKVKMVMPRVDTKTHHDDILEWAKENL